MVAVSPGSVRITADDSQVQDYGRVCSMDYPDCGSNVGKAAVGTGTVTPVCFARLKFRPVAGPANHSFWWIQISSGAQYIIDAGPTGDCVLTCGYLDDYISLGTAGYDYPADNSDQPTSFDSGTSSAVCSQVTQLLTYAETWPQFTYAYYLTGPNSNTFAHGCATAGGFAASQPPGAVGW